MAEEQLKYADFEELVFENRNKAYGAYDLRRSYRGLLTRAFLIGVLFFSGMVLLPLLYSKTIKTEAKEEDGTTVILNPEDFETVEEEDPVPDEPFENKQEEVLQSLDDVAPPSEQVATIANVVPEPVENAPIETPPPTKKDMENKAISTKTQEGVAATNNAPPPVQGVEGGRGTQAKIEGAKIVDKPVDTKEIHTSVDVEADYGNGGLNGFRAKVAENFDSEAVQGEGMLTTTVKFVVETNGTVSQVKATGANPDFNREAERVVRSIKGWKPAKKGGVNVRSYYSLPLKMKFE
ncbi:MAG: energy transducer TonB [Flavobacteriaceae bacterium]|jgi:tonB family protein|nr:energy transducer TonB [Flavobacteriaceae bacterium]